MAGAIIGIRINTAIAKDIICAILLPSKRSRAKASETALGADVPIP